MKEYQIKIEPFPFIALQELRIEQEINRHGKVQAVIRIKDEWKDAYMTTLLGETWVKVIGKGEGANGDGSLYMVMFYGLVTDFSFSVDGYETLLKLEIMSGSIKMDMAPHFRVFQNEDALCKEICRQLTADYPEGGAVCTEGDRAKLQGVMLQYGETDWEFLKRVAQKAGGCV